MNEFRGLGMMIVIGGIALVLMGLFLMTVGKLPGDILLKKGNFTFFFPIVGSIVLSIILTIVLNLFFRK